MRNSEDVMMDIDSTYSHSTRDFIYKGLEVWRYDGSDWEKIVGENETVGRGFGDSNNIGALSMKVFTNETNHTHLYVGTINYNWTDIGYCQIWRTKNGDDWEKVVDKGFRDNESVPDHSWYGVKNAYLWNMEVFQGKLYAGTFNIPVPPLIRANKGCQLWRLASGNSLDWEKVNLPNGSDTGQYRDGFGEKHFNFGIRRLVNWSNNLYVGLATHFLIGPLAGGKVHSCELWKYDGGSDWSDWECIVGDDSTNDGDEWGDGFGDYHNKYLWSLTECGDSLWAGTISAQILDCIPNPLKINIEPWMFFKIFNVTGCKLYRYNGTHITKIAHDDGGEIGSGFGDHKTLIVRYSVEYPKDSGKLFVGLVQGDMLVPEEERKGCSVWMRHE